MGELVYFISKLKTLVVGVVKASINNTKVIKVWPETKWSNLDQVENFLKDRTRVCAAYWDELRLGVKVHIKLGIAGFPRNLFK